MTLKELSLALCKSGKIVLTITKCTRKNKFELIGDKVEYNNDDALWNALSKRDVALASLKVITIAVRNNVIYIRAEEVHKDAEP